MSYQKKNLNTEEGKNKMTRKFLNYFMSYDFLSSTVTELIFVILWFYEFSLYISHKSSIPQNVWTLRSL